MVDNPVVAVVILNYNGLKHLQTFLPSVEASNYPNLLLWVVDNASTDGSVAWLRERGYGEGGRLRLLVFEENHGFAGGYNLAVEQIEVEDLVFLNSDVEVAEDWLWEPLAVLRGGGVGACQPKVLSYHRRDYFEHAGAGGGYLDAWAYPFCRGRLFDAVEADQGQYDDTQEVFWASGAAMFIKRSIFRSFGGFEAWFFAHMEEIDLCWRLKRGGYKIMYVGSSKVWHWGGGTLQTLNPRKTYLNFRNNLAMMFHHSPKPFRQIFGRLLLDGLAGLRFLSQGELRQTLAIVKAHWHFFAKIPQLYQRRKALKQLIQAQSIGPETSSVGRWPKSLVKAFFLNKKRSFPEL